MTIPVTTRSVKGSKLTFTEMDDNFNDLSRNSTKTVQGNIEVADQTETDALSSETLAISPSTLQTTVETIIDNGKTFVGATDGYSWDENTNFILLWGNQTIPSRSWTTVTLPTTITAAYTLVITPIGDGSTTPSNNFENSFAHVSGTTVKIYNNFSLSVEFHWQLTASK